MCKRPPVRRRESGTGSHLREQPDRAAEISELSTYPYQGEVTADLMPIDWTFLEADVPVLISALEASDCSALYVDADKSVCVTSAGDILIRYDAGNTWAELNTEEVSKRAFSEWLWKNDPLPGYSMEDLQKRLDQDAVVRHTVFDDQQEMYFVIDETGVQIELVQPNKIESVLLDGVRLMFTSTGTKFQFSNHTLRVFNDTLKDAGITADSEASSEWNGFMERLTEGGVNFYEPAQNGQI